MLDISIHFLPQTSGHPDELLETRLQQGFATGEMGIQGSFCVCTGCWHAPVASDVGLAGDASVSTWSILDLAHSLFGF